jgi:hypothetical protein
MAKVKTKILSPSKRGVIVRQSVSRLLEDSPSFSKLPATTRTNIARDTARLAGYLADVPEGTSAFPRLIEEVNFPAFVANLINGVFEAIVDGSIRQMKAYAELVAAVSKTLDQFRDENLTDKQARDHLTETFPKFFKPDRRIKVQKPRLLKKPVSSRQQLLATMVLMGINRIVVTDGRIGAKSN